MPALQSLPNILACASVGEQLQVLGLASDGGGGMTLLAAGAGSTFIAQLIAFLILAFLVGKFGVPILKKAIDDRGNAVRDEFDKLERETRASSQAVADIKTRLANIDAESKSRIARALDEGARMKLQAEQEATQQAAAEHAKAKRDIQIERDKTILELRMEVVRRTIEVTERAVETLVDEPLHGKMVDKYLGELEKAAKL